MSNALPAQQLNTKVRRLTQVCLAIWFLATLAPVVAARYGDGRLWGWPVDFWLAAQGCVLVYLLLVGYFAWQVNRWERQAGASAIEIPAAQDV